MKLYLDTETCGLHGMIVLIQYAYDDGPIQLYEPWKEPVSKTLALLQEFARHTVVGFNLTFDWFHVAKLYTILLRCQPDWIPEDHIDQIAGLEPLGMDGPCLKPEGALDLMLHARKGPYQSLMQRDDIRVRRVPTSVAQKLAAELEGIEIDPIYFAKYKKMGPRWKVYPKRDPAWSDIVLKFNASGSLKALAEHALGVPAPDRFEDIELDKKYRPVELGYAPCAQAISYAAIGWKTELKQANVSSGLAWPGVIQHHIEHWHTNERARTYALKDIEYTRGLDKFFDCPECNDDDSVLACMVGALRWRGYAIDHARIKALRAAAQAIVDASPINTNRAASVRAYLEEVMLPEERLIAKLDETTGKENLQAIARAILKPGQKPEPCWADLESEPCGLCLSWPCPRCCGRGTIAGHHPAAVRAADILKIKHAKKEVEFCDKLLLAGRLHADFVVIGAKSSRMSGAGGVNAHAVKTGETRGAFPLAWPGYQLTGGDFAGFENTIADAVFRDPALRAALLSGKKMGGLFGAAAYDLPYEQVTANKPMYGRAKAGQFLDLFGGEARTLAKTLDLTVEEAARVQANWQKLYPGIKEARARVAEQFGCLKQEILKGPFVWIEPQEAAYTLLGFPRFFTTENKLVRSLYDAANRWANKARDMAGPGVLVALDQTYYDAAISQRRVCRSRGRLQTPEGAASSALFGAACNVAASNVRAAGNHEIQGTGAGITKSLQRQIWDLQPAGEHEFVVMPMNVHDEIMCPAKPEYIERVAEVVKRVVEGYRSVVPLLNIEWYRYLPTWADKDGKNATGQLELALCA